MMTGAGRERTALPADTGHSDPTLEGPVRPADPSLDEAAGHGDAIHLARGVATASIALQGGELQHWSVGGRALLWNGDARFWEGRSPILFPVVGWTRGGQARVGGRSFPLGLHGFAKDMRFSLHEAGPDFAVLRLRESPASLALYPFAFTLAVEYRLREEGLSVAMTVSNEGDGPMPYSAGLHPGFLWPLPGGSRAGQSVVFERAERPEVPVIAPGGLISGRRRPVPLDGRALRLTEESFATEAMCFIGAASRTLRYGGPDAWLDVTFENLPNIVLWSRPGAPFLCIEGWCGMGDPEGFEGDLFEKPGMTVLERGRSATHRMDFAFGAQS